MVEGFRCLGVWGSRVEGLGVGGLGLRGLRVEGIGRMYRDVLPSCSGGRSITGSFF